MSDKFPYNYGPRRNKAIQEATRLFGIFDGTRTFVMDVWILRDLLDELQKQTHLARQYGRTLIHFDPKRNNATIADLKRRVLLARRYLKSVSSGQFVTGALVAAALRALDTREPLPLAPLRAGKGRK